MKKHKTSSQQELLAIMRILEHFHKCLNGLEFHLRTEHYVLTWLMSSNNLKGQTASWIQCLQEHNFNFKQLQGQKHNADALSG
jgi:hypothetical protein